MTDQKKETVWITIPDEGTPVLNALMKTSRKESPDRVQNKAFWSVGFVALVVFFALLFAPQEFAGLMKGQLFDGGFKIIPDNAAEQSGDLFGETKTDTTTATADTTTGTTADTATGSTSAKDTTTNATGTADTQNENVVQPESDAVSIQVEPLTDTSTGTQAGTTTTNGTGATGEAGTTSTTATGTGTTTSTGTGTTTGTGTSTGTTTGTGAEAVTLDANAQLLQDLSKQVEDFKEKQRQSDQQIQDLMQLLADQSASLHGAASDTGAQATNALGTGGALGTNQTGQIGQIGGFNTAQLGAGMGAGVYRYNTHTVTVSPYDVLAKNQGIQVQQASYQANVTNTGIQAYSAQNYNPALSGVRGQPGTGPAETLLFALMLASFGILIWGIIRSVRA